MSLALNTDRLLRATDPEEKEAYAVSGTHSCTSQETSGPRRTEKTQNLGLPFKGSPSPPKLEAAGFLKGTQHMALRHASPPPKPQQETDTPPPGAGASELRFLLGLHGGREGPATPAPSRGYCYHRCHVRGLQVPTPRPRRAPLCGPHGALRPSLRSSFCAICTTQSSRTGVSSRRLFLSCVGHESKITFSTFGWKL